MFPLDGIVILYGITRVFPKIYTDHRKLLETWIRDIVFWKKS